MKILGKQIVKLTGVFSEQVNKKTGTIVQKALNSQENMLTGGASLFSNTSLGVTKLITYGKKTPLYQKGIHQVQITKLKDGSENYQYFRNGKEIYARSIGNDFGGESNSILQPKNLMDKTTFKSSLRDNLKALLNSISNV